jgi:pimeloyl-ACP methyl ester carboxylesterase
VFLPGAGASASFWRPVAAALPPQADDVFLSWPGLGDEPAMAGVQGLDDLIAIVPAAMPRRCDLIAQSLGGVAALRVALTQPERVRKLVLMATSGGVPVRALGGSDWRDEYFRTYPRAARWIGETHGDLSDELRCLRIPTLLIWGEQDAISPVAVGRHLLAHLPDARLHVVPGAGHDAARSHPQQVADLIDVHLQALPAVAGRQEPTSRR